MLYLFQRGMSILFIVFAFTAEAQSVADTLSLKKQADNAYNALYSNLDSARTLAEQVMIEAQKAGDFNVEMDAYNTIGFSFYFNYEFEKARTHFQKGLDQLDRSEHQEIASKLLNSIGMCGDQLTEYPEAIAAYGESLAIDRLLQDSSSIPIDLGNMAIVYSRMGLIDSAIIMQKEAITIREELESSKVHTNYNNIGASYHRLGRYDLAIENYIKAAEIRNSEQLFDLEADTYSNLATLFSDLKDHENSIRYAEMSEEIMKREGLERGMAQLYTAMGNEYKRIEEFSRSQEYYTKGLQLAKAVGDKLSESILLHNIGSVHDELEEWEEALNYYEAAYEIKKENDLLTSLPVSLLGKGKVKSIIGRISEGEEEMIEAANLGKEQGLLEIQRAAAQFLSEHFERQGEHLEALNFSKQQVAFADSIFSVDYSRRMEELYVAFETERTRSELLDEQLRSRELDSQRAQAEIEAANDRSRFTIAIASLVALLLIGLFLYYRSRQHQKNRLVEVRIEEQRRGLDAVITAQEDERQRIAKDLHDGIVQELGGLKLGLQKVFSGIPMPESKKLLDHLDRSTNDLRELSHRMMPRSLGEVGLVPTIEEMLDNSLGQTEVEYAFEHYGLESRLSKRIEVTLYRVAQELVNNVIKHSGASKVGIQLFKNGDMVVLIVEDNGKGMNDERDTQGIGLMNISSRLDTVHGEVDYSPSPESGTLATIRIPLAL